MKFVVKLVVGLLTLVIAVGAGMFLAWGPLSGFSPLEESTTNSNTLVGFQEVTDVVAIEEIALLSLAVNGVEESRKDAKSFAFGWKIPGSERAKFIRYTFTSKLGVKGDDVEVKQTGDQSYLITVNKFSFIGRIDPHFETAIEQNGALSWANEKIEDTAMVNNVQSSEAQEKYIAENRDALVEQATNYYTRLIGAIAPEVTLEFEFPTA